MTYCRYAIDRERGKECGTQVGGESCKVFGVLIVQEQKCLLCGMEVVYLGSVHPPPSASEFDSWRRLKIGSASTKRGGSSSSCINEYAGSSLHRSICCRRLATFSDSVRDEMLAPSPRQKRQPSTSCHGSMGFTFFWLLLTLVVTLALCRVFA